MRFPFTEPEQVRPIDVLHRQAHAVAMVGLRQHRHHQRGVVDRAGHRAGAARHVGRIDRDAPEARLQPDQPAPAGRQAHRAPDIGADVERPVAGRACRARTGARAAGVLREVPRIARERMEARHAGRGHAEVGHRGLGKDDRARLAQPCGRGCILCHRCQRHRRRTQRHRHAFRGDVLLHGHRHAIERTHGRAFRPALGRGRCFLARGFRLVGVKRFQMRLPARDVLLDRCEDFGRGERLGAIALQQLGRGQVMDVGHRGFSIR